MCLTIEFNNNGKGRCFITPKPMIAEKDIICYKVLRVSNHCPEYQKITTPYCTYPITIKKKHCIDEEESPIVEFDYSRGDSEFWQVGSGMFHSFAKFDDAMEEADSWSNDFLIDEQRMTFLVFYAIIPKGAKYYKGTFELSSYGKKYEAYASNELIICENAGYIGRESGCELPESENAKEQIDFICKQFHLKNPENHDDCVEYEDLIYDKE